MASSQKKIVVRTGCAALIAVLSGFAAAGTLQCDGKITDVRVWSDGSVMVKPTWRNDWVNVCRVNVFSNNIDPATCKALYTAAITAMQIKTDTTMYYGNTTAATCAAMPTLQQASPLSEFWLKSAP